IFAGKYIFAPGELDAPVPRVRQAAGPTIVNVANPRITGSQSCKGIGSAILTPIDDYHYFHNLLVAKKHRNRASQGWQPVVGGNCYRSLGHDSPSGEAPLVSLWGGASSRQRYQRLGQFQPAEYRCSLSNVTLVLRERQ